MTKVDIYSGFLGAGKTTLIKKMIQEAYQGQKLVLIENEFGEIGIDGGFLQDAGINITEMNSGCICCSLVGDFGKALEQVIAEYHPDRVIIEPSGVGKLSDVMGAVEKVTGGDVTLGYTVAVCDAGKVKVYMKNFGEFYNNQIETASTIILSRTDSVPQAKLDASVERILDMKEALGLFDNPELPTPLTEEENAEIENLTYEVATKAATLINNIGDIIPVDSKKVKNVVIVKVSGGDDDNEGEFDENLQIMVDTFAGYGIKADLRDGLKSKAETKELSEQYDLIVMATNKTGMPIFFEKKIKSTMMAAMAYGAEKTVVVAFGTPAIYYTYFEQSNAFICTCSLGLPRWLKGK